MFLAILIAQRILRAEGNIDLAEIAQDTIVNFPPAINASRNTEHMYSIEEAYDVLDIFGLRFTHCACLAIPCTSSCTYEQAFADLCRQLLDLLYRYQSKTFCCIYICPPYSVVICKTATGALSIIDTHPVPEQFGGCNTAAVISVQECKTVVVALCQIVNGGMSCNKSSM
jgi:hypothetical protein